MALWPTKEWQTSSLEEQQINGAVFRNGLASTTSQRHGTTSFVVVRHGALVWEYYADGYDRNSKHYIFSVTKSVLSAVVGIAIDQGYIQDVEQSVSALMGSDEFGEMDDVQLHHLLTMCAGYTLKHVHKLEKSLTTPVEVIRASDPGTSFVYQDDVAHLVSKIVTACSGKTVLALADEFLFGPIGVTSHHWPADKLGITSGQAGLEWSALDMARFGYLYLKDGMWDGQQVVPKAWVDVSTQKQCDGGPPVNQGYGYFWWVAERGGYQTFYAGGFGGQRLFVIPELDLVVVVTSDYQKNASADFYLEDVILPAIERS